MRKIIVSNLVSLDGFFEGPNRELDWFAVDEEFLEYARTLLTTVDTILFGRITYQHMAAYWPTASGTGNDAFITEKMNNLHKIVFSETLSTVEWNNSTLIKENIVEAILKMKQKPGKDMVIFGSGQIVSAFTQWRLIDEYRIIINPVILGNGNPLFKGLHDKLDLKFLKTQTLGSGIVILYYQPAKK